MSSHDQLEKDILADGVIDADEVAQLRAILYDDGVIDRAEADLLFRLNDGCSSFHSSWEDLFLDALVAHLLEDDESPGELDKSEAAWLADKILADGEVDELERALLVRLQDEGATLPEDLANLLT
jgi:uncharacterized tellurite resistance protein B-like protein